MSCYERWTGLQGVACMRLATLDAVLPALSVVHPLPCCLGGIVGSLRLPFALR